MNSRKRKRPAPAEAMKDRAFHDLWMTAQGPALCSSVADAMATLNRLDATDRDKRSAAGERTRRPQPEEVKRRREMIGNILANLLWLHHDGHRRSRLIVDLSKRGIARYRPPIFRQLKPTLDTLEAAGFIVWHGTEFYGWRTTIEATADLKAAFDRHGATPADIGRQDDEETVILAPRPGREGARKLSRLPIDYLDVPRSKRYRREMRTINACLAAARIELQASNGAGRQPMPAWHLVRRFSTADPDAKSQPFDLHGRLYPQPDWWLAGLGRNERHRLRINGEPLAYLDFSNMHARLAYAEAGKAPPAGDLYRVPGFEDHREGIKKAFAAMLAKRSTRRQFSDETMALFPAGTTAAPVADAIRAHHPGIEHLFGTDRTIRYMFLDSTIMVAVLLRLAAMDVSALPLHDGLLVVKSASATAKGIMECEGARVAGAALPVAEKDISEVDQELDGDDGLAAP